MTKGDGNMNKKIGFIGYGNMAKAIAEGLLKVETFLPEQIIASARDQERLRQNTQELGIRMASSNLKCIQESDYVVIAVKPQQVESLLEQEGIKEALSKKIVISIAVNLHFSDYEKLLTEGTAHLSILPNTPASVAEGAFIFEATHSLNEEEFNNVKGLFETIANIQVVATEQMGVAGVINGCGPAFVALFIEALGDGAVKYGLSREAAYALASQTLVGTGKLQIETGKHPGVMKDEVTSPGGTTIKGVSALEENGFRSAVIQAFDAILDK